MRRYDNPLVGLYKEVTEEARKKLRLMIKSHNAKSVDLIFSDEVVLFGFTYNMDIIKIELRNQSDLYAVHKDDNGKILTIPLKALIGHDVIAIYSYLWKFETKVKFY